MNNVNVKFIGKEYSISRDVVKYVDLVGFTNGIRDNLMKTFIRKIKNIEVLEDANFMMEDINAEVSKFISKLLEYDIYDKTVNDYLNNNKGIDLFLDTKKKALRHIISIRQEKLDVYKSGVKDAIYKKEASVTGLDFGVLTSSFTNAMIYAFMDASEEAKQEKEALNVYNREIADLQKSVKLYDEQERKFIVYNFRPAMNSVFTYFSYELLDRFVADLIRTGGFDKEALKFVDLERSNDLLKNLDMAKNKYAVIEQSFIACPFNIAVYMNAMKYDILDYDTFQTAKYFKQSDTILEFLKEQLGVANYPNYTKSNYCSAVLLSQFTGKSVDDILFQHTLPYASAVVNEYRKLVNILNNQTECDRVVHGWNDVEILAGDKTSKQYAGVSVKKIVADNTWESLINECGHKDLLNQLLSLIPSLKDIYTKAEFDKYLRDRLFVAFEESRKKQVEQVVEKKEIEQAQRQKEEEQKRKKKTKAITIGCVLVAIIVLLILLPSLMHSAKTSNREKAIETEIEKITTTLEEKIESQIDDDIIINYSYKKFNGSDSSWMWSFDVQMAKLVEFRKNGGTDKDLLLEILDNCRIIDKIVEDENDTFDFGVEVGDDYIEISNYDGDVQYIDSYSHETFYYDDRGGERYLYSSDTEYVLEDID